MNKTTLIATLLYCIVVGFLIVSGINPADRFTWYLEVSWVLLGLIVLLVFNFKGNHITWLLAGCLFAHALILIYGGWYTYEKVPLGFWVSDLLGIERNHYDRLGHFVQGFVPAVLVREILIRNKVVVGRWWRELIVFAFIMAFTGIFEILEFAAAKAFGHGADAFLGSQGDVWDAQWDMLLCGVGGIVSAVLLSRWHERQIEKLGYRQSSLESN